MFIVFDWDGTLVDSCEHIVTAMQSTVRQLGLEQVSNQQCASKIGLGLREAVASLYPGISDWAVTAFCESYSANFLALASSGFPLQLFAGVEEALERLLEQGHQLAVATGKSRRGLDRVLGESRLTHYFCATRTADETASKPNPLMLSQLLAETGNDAQNTIMVGDTSYDLNMAQKAGVAAVGVLCGVHDELTLQSCDPMLVLDGVSDLPTSAPKIQQRLVMQE